MAVLSSSMRFCSSFLFISSISLRLSIVDTPPRQSSRYSFISLMLMPQFFRHIRLFIHAISRSSKIRLLFLSRFTEVQPKAAMMLKKYALPRKISVTAKPVMHAKMTAYVQ